MTGRLHPAATLCLLLAACSSASTNSSPNTLTPAQRDAGWRLLFDGRTTDGWRGFKTEAVPGVWAVVDGALTRVAGATGGGDIMTREKFANFELALDWKVAPGGNSGIFYRASQDDDEIYWTAPEMQVLDDAAHADGANRLTSAGANYGLDAAPAGIVKKAGEWNHVEIRIQGNHVEHWLNGVKVVQYELGSADWEAKVKASKFAPHPHYGRNATGFIALQDHGDQVSYRNIRIRVLP
jgi:hypothetical protein